MFILSFSFSSPISGDVSPQTPSATLLFSRPRLRRHNPLHNIASTSASDADGPSITFGFARSRVEGRDSSGARFARSRLAAGVRRGLGSRWLREAEGRRSEFVVDHQALGSRGRGLAIKFIGDWWHRSLLRCNVCVYWSVTH